MTSGNMTRRAVSAQQRADMYSARLAACSLEQPRGRINAVIGWVMSEWLRLPEGERETELSRLLVLVREWNGRAAS